MTGVLAGLRVLEFGSIGPGPFCAMMLADHGADVVRIDRASAAGFGSLSGDPQRELLLRNRRSIELDLKSADDLAIAKRLAAHADVIIEGNRPGVMERLGLGPDQLRAENRGLVYGRMTGWGQTGPYAQTVGHDVNYISTSGTLGLIGRRGQPPTIPPALVGDFGGGGMFLAFGIMAALWERQRSGEGQVVDAAILDGASLLTTAIHGFRQTGGWSRSRQDNLIDGGAPFYEVYETADHGWIALGALEPRFYLALLQVLDLGADLAATQHDRSLWPERREQFAGIIRTRTRTRDEWVERADGTEACISPVLDLEELGSNPQIADRGVLTDVAGLWQPAPAPRFSRTGSGTVSPPPRPGTDRDAILADWGV